MISLFVIWCYSTKINMRTTCGVITLTDGCRERRVVKRTTLLASQVCSRPLVVTPSVGHSCNIPLPPPAPLATRECKQGAERKSHKSAEAKKKRDDAGIAYLATVIAAPSAVYLTVQKESTISPVAHELDPQSRIRTCVECWEGKGAA